MNFRDMDPERRRELARQGGIARHAQGTGHEYDSREARNVAAKCWLTRVKQNAGFTSETEQRILQRIAAAMVVLLCAVPLSAQPLPREDFPAGCTYDVNTGGGNCHAQIFRGTSPIVVFAPHGGTYQPTSIPLRTAATCGSSGFTTAVDTSTAQQARSLANLLNATYVINLLNRNRLDANRSVESGACGNATAIAAWNRLHVWVQESIVAAAAHSATGKVLLVGLHGHALGIRCHLGMGLSNTAHAAEDLQPYLAQSTLRALMPLTLTPFTTIYRDLGWRLSQAGYPCVPARDDWRMEPADDGYMGTGYSESLYSDDAVVAGVTLELPYVDVRDTQPHRAAFSAAFTSVLTAFLEQFGVTW